MSSGSALFVYVVTMEHRFFLLNFELWRHLLYIMVGILEKRLYTDNAKTTRYIYPFSKQSFYFNHIVFYILLFLGYFPKYNRAKITMKS